MATSITGDVRCALQSVVTGGRGKKCRALAPIDPQIDHTFWISSSSHCSAPIHFDSICIIYTRCVDSASTSATPRATTYLVLQVKRVSSSARCQTIFTARTASRSACYRTLPRRKSPMLVIRYSSSYLLGTILLFPFPTIRRCLLQGDSTIHPHARTQAYARAQEHVCRCSLRLRRMSTK